MEIKEILTEQVELLQQMCLVLEKEYEINPKDFLSKGKATPFEKEKVYGECKMTVCSGKVVYKI